LAHKLNRMIAAEITTELELYFQQFRKNIIGIDQEFDSPFGTKKSSIPIGLPVVVCTVLLKKK